MNNMVEERVAELTSPTYYKELLMGHLTLALERFAAKNPDKGSLEDITERFVGRFPVKECRLCSSPQKCLEPVLSVLLNGTGYNVWVEVTTHPSLTVRSDYVVAKGDILLDAEETYMYFKDPFNPTSIEMVEFELETGHPYIFSEELLDKVISKVLKNLKEPLHLHQAGAVIYRFSS